jgi:hypothetical protein
MRRVAVSGLFVAALAASACGSDDTAAPATTLVTVQGQVVENTVPAVDATIYATDHEQIAAALADASLFPTPAAILADGTGHFGLYGFGASYDLVIFPVDAPRNATVVQNLTRRDPTIGLPLPANADLHTCHIATTWTTPPPAGASIAYFLQGGPSYPGVELVSVVPVDSNIADGLTATWRGSFSTTANIGALAYLKDPTTNLPTNYVGFSSTYAFLIDQRSTQVSISLQTTKTSSVAANFQLPSGYSVESVDVSVDLNGGAAGSTSFDLAHFESPTGTLSVNVPDLFDNRVLVRGTAQNGAVTSSAAAVVVAYPATTSNATLTFPTASDLVAPADGSATVDPSTTFSFNGAGVNEVIFSSTDAGAPTLRVVTSAQSFTLGQFLGLENAAIPAGAHYTWSTRRWPDFATVDPFEDTNVDLPNANNAQSASRSFTFASP